MSTYFRPNRHGYPHPACDCCSPFDADGFPLSLPGDPPDGERCWAPRWSMRLTLCVVCGEPVDPEPLRTLGGGVASLRAYLNSGLT